jgi:caffeoyl-CoA O-methyltransferase
MSDQSDATRSFGLGPAVETYVRDHLNPPADQVMARLTEATVARFGGRSSMSIGEDQGRLMQLLVELIGARNVVEVGTFTGTSALWLARGVGPEGTVTCFELHPAVIEVARTAWKEAGVDDRISVVIGPALDGLRELPTDRSIDVAFVDADKTNYRSYVELLLERVRPGGLILVDNTLWGGAVVDPAVNDESTTAIRELNDWLTTLDDVEVVILSIGDGLTVVRRTG